MISEGRTWHRQCLLRYPSRSKCRDLCLLATAWAQKTAWTFIFDTTSGYPWAQRPSYFLLCSMNRLTNARCKQRRQGLQAFTENMNGFINVERMALRAAFEQRRIDHK
ncbi:uncharacterized protein MYCFIDRAFT_211214 [Pseudocercospora fijiensis CIRAD86]|uniref:Uncharacterized protein n=1 Tax=Pseudocercospora fijiensis (strain CIRAD86) TaxID=383855 RepID=M3AEG1_PSEFD|nr:uncharacterized protein MYCFIDRAFT_211214 [Pseudocercospora fijiensis CIRAD86]EME82981.1 hypothetical protein MYCFIDRAFT_211214 [Pseudocercospora fijiensis CIRAD86]